MGQPFYLNQYTGQDLTVVIYWRKQTGIDTLQNGHAALVINTRDCKAMDSDYYVSWLGSVLSVIRKRSFLSLSPA
jgi:hypothetical protein